jgi:glyceraldehyde-3-phosphate dehydrogenase (NADP+)
MRVPFAGGYASGAETFDVHDKFTGETIDSAPLMKETEVERAIGSAYGSLKTMYEIPAYQRREILEDVAHMMDGEREKLASVLVAESGMTHKQAEFEVRRAANIIRLYSTETTHLNGETVTLDGDPRGRHREGYWFRVPAGVVGAISAFNNPLVLLAHKLGPAFAVGNAVVFKPASLTPIAASRVCELFIEAGVPAAALSVVTGRGEDLGAAMARSPHIRVISFTGGKEAGERLIRAAGVKKMVMELGSNCPNIVFSDANIESVAKTLVDAAYSYQGQNCLHAQRILVHESVYDEFRTAFIDRASKLRLGDPRSPTTDIGPMISEASAKRVEEFVADATRLGAKLLLGGHRSGVFFEPTLLENVAPTAKMSCEEVFGPVSALIKFSSIKRAIEIANSTNYGLQAAIFTNDSINQAYALKNLNFGAVMVNESTDFRVDMMPFGGFKDSGLGREGLRHAIENMSEVKTVVYNLEYKTL